MLQMIETKTIDAELWNIVIGAGSFLITIFLGIIVRYQYKQSEQQERLLEKITTLAIDISAMKENSNGIKSDVDEIKTDVGKIKDDLKDHDKRISKLEVVKNI